MRSLILVLVLGAAVYAGIVNNPRVYEEGPYHPRSASERLTLLVSTVGHGTGELARVIWPASETGVRIENVALHLIVGVLVWSLATMLQNGREWAWVAAGTMILHPMNLEAVAYGVETPELLVAIGVLIAAVGVLTGGLRGAFVVVVGAALAVAAKRSGIVVVPILGLTAIVAYARGTSIPGDLFDAGLGILVVAIGVAWYGVQVMNAEASMRFSEWVPALSSQIWHHLFQIVTLQGFSIDEAVTRGWPAIAAIYGVGLLGVLTVYLAARGALVFAVGLGWILAAMLPRYFVIVSLEILPEHHFYVAMIGVSLLAAEFARRAAGSVRLVAAGALDA